ncbi:DUF6801 domain-containing protein [Actinophytocola xinjiangensis]|nr:DUF6801 domain-containing protein [Actinophytocola xinjiangensis]
MSGRRWWAIPGMAGVAVLAAGLVGPLPMAAAQDETVRVDARLTYLCPFVSGEQPVEVRLAADLPAGATAGEPVRPAGLAISLTVPQAGVAELTALGAASVTALARVGVAITHGGSTAETNWSGTKTSRVVLPTEGDLTLPLEPSRVTPAVLGQPGAMTFAAADTSLELTGYQSDGAVTDPPSLALSCALAPDQDATLATVQVSAADTPVPVEPPPGAVRVDKPKGSAAAPEVSPTAVEIPEDCEQIESPNIPWPPPPETPTNPPKYCAYITAFTNLAKLDASVLQPPSLVNIGPTAPGSNKDSPRPAPNPPRPGLKCVPEDLQSNILCQKANILPNLGGRPVLTPAENQWVLPFGFVPTKATMQLTQLGVSQADIRLHLAQNPVHAKAVVTARYTVRVYDAAINGVPFDLGPHCRTAEPLEIVVDAIAGFGAGKYLLDQGGVLNGEVVIPPFTGCGVTEDVSPLLTGLISGPGNLVRLTQGKVCTITGTNVGCNPIDIPEPVR